MAPAQRRLSSCPANPASHTGQFATRDVFPRVPVTARIPVPIPITQECVGSVSQAAGAAAGWLAALDPLADEMDPLAVLSWDMQVPKLTERPPTRPLSMLDRAPADGPWCAGSSLRLRSPIVTAPKDVDHSTSKAMRCPKARCLIDEDLVTNQRVPRILECLCHLLEHRVRNRAGGRFRLRIPAAKASETAR